MPSFCICKVVFLPAKGFSLATNVCLCTFTRRKPARFILCKATILESALKMRGRRAQTATNFYLVKIFPFDVWHVHIFTLF